MAQYCFIHLPKCGGSYISTLMYENNKNGKYIMKGHNSVEKKDPTLTYVGNIRHPYDIYKSLWNYGCERQGGVYNYVKKNYPHYAYLYSSKRNIKNFRLWLGLILTNTICYNGEDMKKYNIGLVTYRFFKLYNFKDYSLLDKVDIDPLIDVFIKLENIKEDLKKIELSYTEIRVNASKYLQSDSADIYYDQELKNLVYSKDRYIFDKFYYQK